jgi:cytochrome c-type biogenesis protein CcmH/NrfG
VQSLVVLRRSLSNPVLAWALLLLAAAGWATVLIGQGRSAPYRRHLDAGRQHASQGEARRAAEEWQAAVRLDPRSAIVWELLGELYTSTSNWQGGAVAFKALAGLTPDAPQVHSRLATCLFRNGNERDALAEARKELERNPDDPAALIISALVLSKMGELDQEVAALEKLLKGDPDNFFALVLLAENLTYRHDYAVARPYVERILKIAPDHAEAYSLRAIATYNEDRSQGGLARAEADFIQSLKHDPQAPFARLYLGKIYRTRGDLKKAIFQLSTAQRLMPNKQDINFELAATYEQAGQRATAAVFRKRFETIRDRMALKAGLQKKCAVDPESFDAHLRLGTLLLNEADYSLARSYLDKAKSLRPDDPRVVRALEQLSMRTEDGADPRDGLQASLRSVGAGPDDNRAAMHPLEGRKAP